METEQTQNLTQEYGRIEKSFTLYKITDKRTQKIIYATDVIYDAKLKRYYKMVGTNGEIGSYKIGNWLNPKRFKVVRVSNV